MCFSNRCFPSKAIGMWLAQGDSARRKIVGSYFALSPPGGWTDITALDISPAYFLSALPRAVPIANLWLATAKSAVFGILIALIGCYFGMKVKPNTESLGRGTTSSVVTSITAVILVDALFAVLFKGIGFRG